MFNSAKVLAPFFKELKSRGFGNTAAFGHQQVGNNTQTHQAQVMARGLPKKKPVLGVKQILLVASGKGGVGKSTTAVNLAAAMKLESPNKEVGLLDADIFGPSVPLMMNLNDSPLVDKNDLMIPLENYGVKCMSMGFLIDDKSPVIWRGLMVMQALDRLLRQVAWGPLDYLIIDTPPGTGDTHLSLVQNIPIAGVALVTTPQSAALQVTRRGANMFKKLKIPIAGIIQNMSTINCPKCDAQISIYGDGTSALAQELGIPLLKDIPLHASITEGADRGVPVVVSSKNTSQAEAYRGLARSIIEFLESPEAALASTVNAQTDQRSI